MTTFSLKNKNVPAESYNELKIAITKKLEDRGCVVSDIRADVVLIATIDETMIPDSFRIEKKPEGITFTANNICTVFAAFGRFLVIGSFDGKGSFTPAALPISHKMKKSLRGMYFASHFYNFYHAAPMEEIYPVIADLALRGCNTLMLCFGVQHYTSAKTPEAVEMITRMKLMMSYMEKYGIAPALILFSNTGFDSSPAELAAQSKIDESGRYKRDIAAVFITELCPSKEGGMAEIERQQREFFEAFAGTPVKYFVLWPYDEGGCLCEKCWPWSTNGFMRVAELSRRLIKEYGYKAEIIISTWHFGVNMEGEWDNFYEHLKTGEYNWAPYIMTCFQSGRLHAVFQKNGVPENVMLIDFPEISMCGAKPWGGFGANPISMFLDNAENNCGVIHDGGFPYSEGIFEDINKWVCFGFYTGFYKSGAEAVRDYIRFEFGIKETDDLLRAIELMESSLPRSTERTENDIWRFQMRWGTAIPEILRIVKEYDSKLPEKLRHSWKWRIIYLRAVIDFELYSNNYISKYSETAQAAYRELHDIFHTRRALFVVCPPEGK
jgi:hypothetical protein